MSTAARIELDDRFVPTYTIGEAAHYVRLPAKTVHNWTSGDWKDNGARRPIIKLEQREGRQALLSFINLVELHVISGLRARKVPLEHIRRAVEYMADQLNSEHPLATIDLHTVGAHMIVEHAGQLLNASKGGQVEMRAVIEALLSRIERDQFHLAARLYPFTRPGDVRDNQPRVVVIDPRISFGRPIIAGRGIATEVVASRYDAGESVAELIEDYGCTSAEIEEAIRCERWRRLAA
jgi:uncharacterized protein (DUF433 family)